MTNEYQTAQLRELDALHHLHPFTDHSSLRAGGARVIVRGDGPYIWDSEGNRILDGMAGLWTTNVGYGRKELADAAYAQMMELPFYNTFFKTATPPTIMLAHKLAGLTGGKLQHVFFNASGSEANDTVFRMVRHYWNLKGEPRRKTFISRWNAYHGSTVAGVSLGGMKAMHAQGDLPIPGIEHVRQPYWFGEGFGTDRSEFAAACAQAIEDKILEVGPENVAAFIGEPIQGAAGVLIPPTTYWPEVQRICRKYGVLIISDEVICGFGRTGKWWGFQSLGFEPDIVTMAKGLSSGYQPIGAVAFADTLLKDFFGLGGEFYHGMTYAGHPVAAAVALKNIEIIEDEKLVERVAEVAPYFAKALASLNDHPIVGETRAMGLLGAIELSCDKTKRARFKDSGRVGTICRDHCFKNNLIMRACWDTMVLAPPFIITKKEIDEMVKLARMALDATYADVKAEM